LQLFEPLLQAYPSTGIEYEAWRNASAAVGQSWQDMSSPPGIMEFLGTREFVQDWDRVRRALGYDKIHILGTSYGTYRGMQYASTYPHHVDRLVFDAPVPHERVR
jgi:pimeloyl-ACP methyl ester carboxylesterase